MFWQETMDHRRSDFLDVTELEERLKKQALQQIRGARLLAIGCIVIMLLALLLCFTSSALAAAAATVIAMVFLALAWHDRAMLTPYSGILENRLLRDLDYFLQRLTLLAILLAATEAGALLLFLIASHGNPAAILKG